MTTRIDEAVAIASSAAQKDYKFSAATLIDTILKTRALYARTSQVASYWTLSQSPTVYYSALLSDGTTVLTNRTHSGVVLVGGLYKYTQAVDSTITDFIAIWDEGDPSVFVEEWIVVDT